MQSAKETASNVAASAKAGMEKTKATMQEKGERMTTRDPLQKELATEKKDERKYGAELEKQEAREHNAAAKQAASGGAHHIGGGGPGGVGLEDPNVAGGARTGHGAGSTF